MRNPFGRRAKESASHHRQTSPDGADDGNQMESMGPTLKYAWNVEPESERKSGKRAGRLVSKLACVNGARDDELIRQQIEQEMQYLPPPSRRQVKSFPGVRLSNPCSPDIRSTYGRKVAVTVHEHVEEKESDCDSEDEESSSGSEDDGGCGLASQSFLLRWFDSFDGGRPSSIKSIRKSHCSKGDAVASSKQRWRKVSEDEGPETDGDNVKKSSAISTDGSTSLRTGYHSNTSCSDTDYTTENSTDDSEMIYPRQRRQPKTATPSQTSSRSTWSGFAEDLGIFAGLLLADGKACMGTFSTITQETVAQPCVRTSTPPPQPRRPRGRSRSRREPRPRR